MKKIISMLFVFCCILVLTAITSNATTVYESENNNSYSTANKLTIGDNITGTMSSGSDNDYYKLVAPNNGKISIIFCHDYNDGSQWDCWGISIYQYNDGEYKELTSITANIEDKEKIELPYIGGTQNGVYYIRVWNFNNRYAINDKEYTIRTEFTKSNNYERENNNVFSVATAIYANTVCNGNMNNINDNDYYKIKAPLDGRISIDFCHEYTDGDQWDYWGLNVYKYEDGEYIRLVKDMIVHLEGNEKVALPGISVKKDDLYYIKISNFYGKRAVNGVNYELKTKFKPTSFNSPSTIKVLSQSVNTVKLLWSEVPNATGYRIYRYTSSGWKAIKTTTSTSYTIAGLSPGTKYIFAVKPYLKHGTGYIWSPNYIKITVATKPDTPILRLATTAKGRATIGWKDVSGENGYQVWYSTSKDSGFQKLNNYKANTTKVYKTGLLSGKTYYFKVRAYKKVNNTYIYSSWSSVEKINIK